MTVVNLLFFSGLYLFLTVCFYHVTYAFQSESTLYSCLNVNKLLARSRREIWSLSDCNWTWTYNHLVHKRTVNHLAKLAEWLSVRLWAKLLWVRVQLRSVLLFCLLAFSTNLFMRYWRLQRKRKLWKTCNCTFIFTFF